MMEVTGRDRVRFFKRPVVPNTAPVPFVRYSRELTQSVDDVKRRDLMRMKLDESSSSSERRPSNHQQLHSAVICSTQTDYRETEVQTDLCTLDFAYDYKVLLRTSHEYVD